MTRGWGARNSTRPTDPRLASVEGYDARVGIAELHQADRAALVAFQPHLAVHLARFIQDGREFEPFHLRRHGLELLRGAIHARKNRIQGIGVGSCDQQKRNEQKVAETPHGLVKAMKPLISCSASS